MTTPTFESIIRRHQPDPNEFGRVCGACARPWPCDVRVLASLVRPPEGPSAIRAASRRATTATPTAARAAGRREKEKVGALV